jgi:2-oxoglutarate dehydrogenase E1 component
MWEAQFGDFMNGAQTIIDEFISSGEQKWGQKSSVVLLLPHGYEGQGPDHSSARIERFLSLCAQDNMTVALPTTPANYFHLLRWQALSGRHKPLIVFTPKSLLRLKAATSPAADFTSGSFKPLIGDTSVDPAKVGRVVLSAGKFYYDLAEYRAKASVTNVAVVRVERLYPIPAEELAAELSRYPADVELVWAQEEPENQGAWPRMALRLPELLRRQVRLISLPASSAPAFGSAKVHAATHRELIETAIPAEG